MTLFQKTTIVITKPTDELTAEQIQAILLHTKRFVTTQLRERSASIAADKMQMYSDSDMLELESHEVWWNPNKFDLKSPFMVQ